MIRREEPPRGTTGRHRQRYGIMCIGQRRLVHAEPLQLQNCLQCDPDPRAPQAEQFEPVQPVLDRRIGCSKLGRFKRLADFDWSSPKRIDRDAVESAAWIDLLASRCPCAKPARKSVDDSANRAGLPRSRGCAIVV